MFFTVQCRRCETPPLKVYDSGWKQYHLRKKLRIHHFSNPMLSDNQNMPQCTGKHVLYRLHSDALLLAAAILSLASVIPFKLLLSDFIIAFLTFIFYILRISEHRLRPPYTVHPGIRYLIIVPILIEPNHRTTQP